MTNELCDCGKIAVWCYLPGFSSGNNPHFCNDCVPRGCDCNYNYCGLPEYYPKPEKTEGVDWKWIEKDKIWVSIDEKGREYPCAEYMWDPEGFERELNPHNYEDTNK